MGLRAPVWNDGFRGFCATATRDLLDSNAPPGASPRTEGKDAKTMHRYAMAVAIAAGLAAAGAGAAEPRQARQAPAYVSKFAKPPADAVKALKATVGRKFDSGYVFIDGKYIPPPYTVERYGNVIRINGIQATREIIPWTEFIKTQSGVKVTKDVKEAPAAPEPEAAPEEDFDAEASLDDLFDDDPAPKKTAKKPKSRPRVQRPTVTVSYSFDGEFVPNDKTKSYVERINKLRTDIDRKLRMGGYYCFGTKYAILNGDAGPAKELVSKLPALQKNNPTKQGFVSAAYSAGLSYLPEPLIADFFAHRLDYLLLDARKKAEDAAKDPFAFLK